MDPGISSLNVPSDIQDMTGSNNLVYTTSANGLIIYGITTPPVAHVPVTAQVEIPKNTGVAVLPNSFSLAPTQTIDGPTSQTLVWNLNLGPSTSQTITWRSALTDLQPGEVRQVTLNTAIQQGSSGFTLAPLDVAVAFPVQTLQIPVQIVVPGAKAIADAADAAGQLGNADLANRLGDLSMALTNVVQNPTSDIFKSQTLADLDALVQLLSDNPTLSGFTSGLTTAHGAIVAATTAADVQAAVNQLGTALDTLDTALSDLAHHNVEVFLSPNTQVAQPQTPTDFEVRLHNIGNDTTTYDLSLAGLPQGVSGQLSQSTVTLDRDGFASVTVTLTPPATELQAFNFTVTVAPEGAAEIARNVTGSLTARQEFVSVVAVNATPPFTDPGGSVDVSAKILNAVNREQPALVSCVVKDSAGQTVFTSQPVATTLTVLTSLTTVDLGTLDTTNLTPGEYAILVSVTTPAGQPVPGGSGEGRLLIGSPVTANESLTSDTLPIGDGTVTNSLEIDSHQPPVGPLSVVAAIPVPNAGGVAQNGNLLYVGAADGIRVYDVTDPSQPQLLRTVGQGAAVLRVHGDTLIALQGVSNFVVSIYSLTDPTTPQFVGSTSNIFYYNLAQQMLVTDTHVFVPVLVPTFFNSNHDIFSQAGDLLSIDISNIFSPHLDGVLLNTHGTDNDGIDVVGGADLSGGDFAMWSAVQVDPTTLLVASTTATGTDTQTGVGRHQRRGHQRSDPHDHRRPPGPPRDRASDGDLAPGQPGPGHGQHRGMAGQLHRRRRTRR